MPVTYNLIASNTLSSSAASVTFSAIPGTYTDLVLRFSCRHTGGGTQYIYITLNNNTSAIYSDTALRGNGSAASSTRDSSSAPTAIYGLLMGGTGYDGFNSAEIYLPSYTASQNKPFSVYNVGEDNATAAEINAVAMLFSSTSAVTEIKIAPGANNLESGSSFFLYGIKNS